MNLGIPDSLSISDDTRIESVTPIITPEQLINLYPLDNKTAGFVQGSREIVSNIIHGNDSRLLAVTGPCSIHNIDEALEYAEKLQTLQKEFSNIFIVMRTYFEKPRTTIGWKGLINDPNLDGSFQIETGLKKARKLLLDINKMGLPVSMEFLDTISPQDIGDLITWGAIGARTTESQLHRELASGLGAPIGFKNGTNGGIQIAIDAINSALQSHNFMGVTKSGERAAVRTKGNHDSHIILRGGSHGTNYDAESIENTAQTLSQAGISTGIIVDVSHANSKKKHENQPIVTENVAKQIAEGNQKIVGIMIESNINEGNQNFTSGKDDSSKLKRGVSITDACVSFEQTEKMLSTLNDAVSTRNKLNLI